MTTSSPPSKPANASTRSSTRPWRIDSKKICAESIRTTTRVSRSFDRNLRRFVMKFLNKKLSLAAAVIVVGITLAYATVTYVARYTVAGTEVFRINNDGSVLSQGGLTAVGPWKRGNTATGSSVT